MNSICVCLDEETKPIPGQTSASLPELSTVTTPTRTAPVVDASKKCKEHPRIFEHKLTYIVYPPTASPDGFTALESEWNRLLKKCRVNSIFSTYEWQTTWWNYLGDGELWLLAFRHPKTDELLGIVPLYRFIYGESGGKDDGGRSEIPPELMGKSQLTLVGCVEVSDYLDLIVARGWEEDVYCSLLDWLQSDHAPQWDILDLCNLPEESQTYQRLPTIYKQAGLQVEIRQEDVAPQFALPATYEHYLQEQVDKKQRHEIRRKQRRAERETEVGFYIIGLEPHTEPYDLESEMNDFLRLQRISRADKAEFMTPEMEYFFRAIARRMYDAGYLRLCFLTLNGDKAATQLTFAYNGSFLLYNSGYDPDAYKQFSPGWVLQAYSIQYAIADGYRLYDFMQGDEEYKYRFGSQEYKVMRTIVRKV
ncbi:GNAT family N-acetyltransferase [Chloroflexi bacterium TSY]|nr:GNAT family N-acetyltransferase [Chloroflexi bacterium TSY]